MTIDLPALLTARLAISPDEEALTFEGRSYSRSWLSTLTGTLNGILNGLPAAGIVARNRPHLVASYAANLVARRKTAMLYAAQGPLALAAEIRQLKLPAIIADRQDWSAPALAAAHESGTAAISTQEGDGANFEILVANKKGHARAVDPTIGLELLSSGTTGPPKRIALSWKIIADVVENAGSTYAGGTSEAPQLMVHPLGNIAGLTYATPPLVFGRRLVLLEKFAPLSWAMAVRDYRPERGTVPPAGIRMLIDSDIPKAWLSSLTLIAVGGDKLDTALQIAFEERFGIPVLPAFGATEFGGVIANWNLDIYRKYSAQKAGSAGQIISGVELRIIDRESFRELPLGAIGLMEAKVARIGPDWIRTNDLASIDNDGFLFLHGRADNAINRGGFKIVPDVVAATIGQHSAVLEAAVVGIPDARLGEVPAAAVELRPDAQVSPVELRSWLKERLTAYQVPVHICIVPKLPRNASLKVALGDVKALFAKP